MLVEPVGIGPLGKDVDGAHRVDTLVSTIEDVFVRAMLERQCRPNC